MAAGSGVELATAYVSLVASTGTLASSVSREFGRAGSSADREGRNVGKRFSGGFAGSIKGIGGAIAGAFAAKEVIGFLGGAINAASDLQEAGTKVTAIFGKEGARAVQQFSDGGAKQLGQTKLAVLDAASTFGTFGKAAGLSGRDLAKFSTGFATLSTDFASFYNTSPEQAVEAIGAALRGEAEPIRQYGILLDDATLRNEALKLGLIKTTKEALTPQQKVLAAQSAIYKQSKDAQGDFARTSGGLANQQRILAAEFEGVKAKLGEALLPMATTVVSFFNNQLGPGITLVGTFLTNLWNNISGGSSGAGSAFGQLRDTFTAAFTVVKDFIVREVLPRVASIWQALQQLYAVAIPIVQQFVSGMIARIQPLMPTIRTIFGIIAQIVTTALDLIRAIIERVTAVIAWVWRNWGQGIMDFIALVWRNVLNIIRPALEGIRGILQFWTSVFKGDWSGAWNAMIGVFKSIWATLKAVVSGALSVLGTILSTAWKGIVSVAGSIWGGITSAISGPINRVMQFIQENLIDKINGLFAFLHIPLHISPIWTKPRGLASPGAKGMFGGSWESGGFTGWGGAHDVAGVVHGREYVINAASTARLMRESPGLLAALNGYASGGYVWPVNARPNFPWGRYPSGGIHRAYDLGVPIGTPVRAPMAGTIFKDGWDSTGYGTHVRIAHPNGSYSILGHMSRELVSVGQKIVQGALIGFSGNTGRSSGPHVHWATRMSPYNDATAFDPMKGVPAGGGGSFLADLIRDGIAKLGSGLSGGLNSLGPWGSVMSGVLKSLLSGAANRAIGLLGLDAGGGSYTRMDTGGWLRPGPNLVYNGLGVPEPVGAAAGGGLDPERVYDAVYRGTRDGVADRARQQRQERRQRDGVGV